MEKILENIKKIRNEKGISQEYIATSLKIEQSSYGLIENGKRKLRYDTLLQIAIALEMNVIDIITFPEKWSPISSSTKSEPIEAILQIKLQSDKKDQVLKLIFGSNNLEILNK